MQPDFSEEKIKRNGAVYTPTNLANFVANKLIEYYFESEGFNDLNKNNSKKLQKKLSNLRIMDPACGDGELLIASWLALVSNFNPLGNKIRSFIGNPQNIFFGVDIDNEAVNIAKRRIKSSLNISSNLNQIKIIRTNALFPFNRQKRESGWKFFYKKYNIDKGFRLVIANPPWGADTGDYQNQFKSNEFILYKGQYDTSDLFIELALNITKENGFFAFIISDSLFNEERTKLRQMLLENTEVKFIGRFGEKIFENINRACAVIICKKCIPNPKNEVDCLRLNPKIRKKIISGNIAFADADSLLSHKVKQTRFCKNPNYIFDIDLKRSEELVLEKFNKKTLSFGNFLCSSRGVELSKYGRIIQCQKCQLWFPLPKSKSPKCPHCSSALIKSDLEHESIVRDTKIDGYKPLLVGESIWRYKLLSRKWMDTSKKGIKYKDVSTYSGPKLLVRKTGVGILSMIDNTDSLTNQVVYIHKLKDNNHSGLSLELFLAILNSRAIYFYLVKRYGETEWRSHPYLTQKQILDLPVPDPKQLTDKQRDNIDTIKSKVSALIGGKEEFTNNFDTTIERLVSSLFNLDRDDYCVIYDTINSVQNLLPIQELKRITCNEIFSE